MSACSATSAVSVPSVVSRLTSGRAARLLARNTTVSFLTFVVGLCLMWALIELVGANTLVAAGIGFVAATSLHYALGRSWIFRGTERSAVAGYGYFLVNAGIGMVLTISLFAALLSWTSINYLIARVVVSIFAGLVMFVLNALLNFKQL